MDRKSESQLLDEIAKAYETIEKNLYEIVYYRELGLDERRHRAECSMRITNYKCKSESAKKKEATQ